VVELLDRKRCWTLLKGIKCQPQGSNLGRPACGVSARATELSTDPRRLFLYSSRGNICSGSPCSSQVVSKSAVFGRATLLIFFFCGLVPPPPTPTPAITDSAAHVNQSVASPFHRLVFVSVPSPVISPRRVSNPRGINLSANAPSIDWQILRMREI
jgi:hypothetical protein